MRGHPGHNTRPHTRWPPSSLGMDAWMSSQMHVAMIRKLRWALVCLTYFIDMLSMGVCSTRHWQTCGRLVQELNVCSVPSVGWEVDRFRTDLHSSMSVSDGNVLHASQVHVSLGATPSEMVVMWSSRENTTSVVKYGTTLKKRDMVATGKFTIFSEGNENGTQLIHRVKLTVRVDTHYMQHESYSI